MPSSPSRADLSILICTYNRAQWLPYTLDALLAQTPEQNRVEIIVVDNNSTDSTQAIISQYQQKSPLIRYCCETTVGLSHGRNHGIKAALGSWLLYIDDDAKAHPDLIETCLAHIDKNELDCVGGQMHPWYPQGKPAWVPEGFQTVLHDAFKPHNDVTGCIMLFRKSALESINGFRTDLGMRGDTVAYGEESDVVKRLLERGMKVYVDPAMNVDHLVADYKLTLKWQINATFAHQRDKLIMAKEPAGLTTCLSQCVRVAFHTLVSPIKYTLRLRKSGYTLRHWALDTGQHIAKHLGRLSGLSANRK